MAVLFSLRDKDANILKDILVDVMVGCGRRSGSASDLLEKLAIQDDIFRYWS